ncbi:xanthine dehydrogenase family protein molybdopterin-binding subunit [Thermogladius sp. KZ2Tp1]|uniref:xanthine dehydrogenase family protein molybdopterin-binding subunit n=1 Tax=Thermogladius sp. KZ2Tp1 TaxID=3136289 RepID=UPI003DAA0923
MSLEDPYSILEKYLSAESYFVVGREFTRVDALEKALGRALFTEDYFVKYVYGNALFVKQVLSPHPHARIRGFHLKEALGVSGVRAVVTHRDIPGVNQVGYALPDQPLLAEGKVRYAGEVVALVAAESWERAVEASQLVKVDYEPLPYVLDPLEAMSRSDVLVHEEAGSNIAFRTKVRKGDVERGFSEADAVVENEYRTHHQDHAYLETEAALALPDSEGRVTVVGAAQHPHLARDITARVLGLPASRVKVVVPYLGGGFGGKDDEGPLTVAKAALVAYLTGRPAFIVYSREESIKVHPKREATIIRYKSGANKEGKLTAIDVTIIHDTGAYANRAPFILWRATMHASGPYEVPNARVDGYAVYTNKVYQGSFRGFGNPSVQFAAERQMDLLAEKLGLDPVEFRLKNILRPGSRTLTNQVLDHSVGVGEALEKVSAKSGWFQKRREYSEYNKKAGRWRRGIGVGVAWHGISTSRGVPDWSNAVVKVEKDGSVTVYTGIVEMGQGSPTSSHVQIVSEILGVPPENVRVVFGTTEAPDTGATHASRGTGIGGIGVEVAAGKIRERLARLAGDILGVEPDKLVFRDGRVYPRDNPEKYVRWVDLVREAYAKGVELSATGYFFLPKGRFDDTVGQGFAYPAFSYIVVVSEVEVDTETGVVRVLRVWPALASGRIISPVQVEGQVEGAVVQGIGYTLYEQLVFDEKGSILNADFTDYVLPTVMEVPEVEKPVYVEDVYKYGAMGAKGVGEMALIPIPASIANAVSHALGVNVTRLPITPEYVLELTGSLKR